ncbi:MAG: EamA family transporter [Burkholderiales bacterium]
MNIYDICFAILVVFIWGVNFVAAKVGLNHLPPILLMSLRFLLVALSLLPFLKKPECSWRTLFILALSYGLAYHSLLFTAVWMGIDVSTSVIAAQLNVPFTSILGVWFLDDKIGWRRLLGMIIAFSGIIIIFGNPVVTQHPIAFLMLIAAAWCWAIFNVQLKMIKEYSILNLLGWISILATPMLFLTSYLFEGAQWHQLWLVDKNDIFSLAYMSILATVCGFGLWSHLLKRHPVSQVAPFSMLMPIFGVLAASLFLDEPLTWHKLWGGSLTLIGVALIILRRPHMTTGGAAVN